MILFLTLVLVISTRISNVSPQLSYSKYNCPREWVAFEKTCIQFVEDSPIIVEEAAANCWINGASLVTVRTFNKHRFISDWLTTNAKYNQQNWTTGGYYSKNILIWNDVELFDGTAQWNTPPSRNAVGYVKYSQDPLTGMFGWTVSSPSLLDNYICEISMSDISQLRVIQRGLDYGLGLVDIGKIERGPKLKGEPMSYVIFRPDTTIHIDCAADGYPAPTFTWRTGSLGNTTAVTSATDDRFTLTGGRLSIESPNTGDVNSYSCVAENELGKVLSHSAQLLYGYLEAFPPQRPADVNAEAFKGVKIDCLAPAYKPLARFQWFKYKTDNYIFPDHPSHFISNAGFLYMSDVQPTDDREYFCVVTLGAPAGTELANSQPPSRTSLGTWLIVKSGNAEPYGPIIYTHTFPSPVIRGRTLRLECIAYGTTPLLYYWSRENHVPFSSHMKLSDRSRVLTIPNVQIQDEGNYICHVSRTGNAASKIISVVVEALPYFPNQIKDMFVDPGQTINWRCMAVARPKPTYAWYRNGEPIKEIPGEIEIHRSTLYIRSVTKDRDNGMYQCSATNWHGTAFSAGQLSVLLFVPNFNRFPLPPMTLAPLGGNLTIPCSVEAAPLPEVRWLKNSGDMNLFPGDLVGRVVMSLNNDLVLTQVTHGDAGLYTCRAINSKGEASNSTRVQVIAGIKIINPPTPKVVLVNTTAFLYCQAAYDSSNYDIISIWRFNGHIIDYSLSSHLILGQKSSSNGLYIREAQYKHTGMYECEAKTILHSDRRSAYVTVQGPPGAPAGVYVHDISVTSTSVRLIWTDGIQIAHGSDVIGYDIEAESDFHPNVWKIVKADIPAPGTVNDALQYGLRFDQKTTLVTYLIPNTGYRFRVRAVNHYGKGKDASLPSSTSKLPATRPVLTPTNIRGGTGKVGTLAIEWTPLDVSEQCGPGIGYLVSWQKKQQGRSNWIQKAIPGNAGTFSATVGKNNYYIEYNVTVTAFNDLGYGPNSTTAFIYSAEGMPIATPLMQDVDGFNGTAVILNWIPITDNRATMKGRVQGYILNYFLNKQGFIPNENYEPDNVQQKRVYGQMSSAMIIGLEPNDEYYVRVMAFNTAGNGPKGEWRRAETNNFAPRDFPTIVKVTPRTEHSVNVYWRGVSTRADEESLQGYIIRIWEIQQDIRTAMDTVVRKTDHGVIEGLQSRIVYVLRVLAYSNGGDGAYSPSVYFTVLGGNVPFDPTTSEICYSEHSCFSRGTAAPNPTLMLIVSLFFMYVLLKLN